MRIVPMRFIPTYCRLPLMVLASVLALSACDDKSRPAYALTSNNTIIKFETGTPKTIESEVALTGLGTGESLLQIDFRPANQVLYGLVQGAAPSTGSTTAPSQQLYYVATVDPDTGAVAKVDTTGFAPPSPGNSTLQPPVVMDINPVGDYLRVIDNPGSATSTTVNNLEVAPSANSDGTVTVTSDGNTLYFNSNDVNAGEKPELVAIAHSNSVGGATTTTLYGLELTTQSLVRITTSGQLYTIAALGHGFVADAGFDIVPDGDQAFIAVNSSGENANLYTLNLTDGTVGNVDQIGGGYQIVSLAVTLPDPKDSNN
jgi:hypothetical protein